MNNNWEERHDSVRGLILRNGDKQIRAEDAARLLKRDMNNWREYDLDLLFVDLQPLIEAEIANIISKNRTKNYERISVPLVRRRYPKL